MKKMVPPLLRHLPKMIQKNHWNMETKLVFKWQPALKFALKKGPEAGELAMKVVEKKCAFSVVENVRKKTGMYLVM